MNSADTAEAEATEPQVMPAAPGGDGPPPERVTGPLMSKRRVVVLAVLAGVFLLIMAAVVGLAFGIGIGGRHAGPAEQQGSGPQEPGQQQDTSAVRVMDASTLAGLYRAGLDGMAAGAGQPSIGDDITCAELDADSTGAGTYACTVSASGTGIEEMTTDITVSADGTWHITSNTPH